MQYRINARRVRTDALALAALATWALTTSSVAAPEVGFRQAAQSDTTLTMLAVNSGVSIENGASTRTLRLAEGSWMQAIERIDNDGWVATGSDDRLSGRRLIVKVDFGRGIRNLPSPPQRHGSLAWWPLPIVHRSELVGLVWLEGNQIDRLSVLGARWLDDSWSTPVVISPPGVGSQAGLSATVLAGGSWLLAWTRWDGEDDEIVWSLGDGDRFSRPALVAGGNAVADILPSVLAEGRGALIAWSQEQGNRYALQMARFDGRKWQPIDTPHTAAVAPQLVRRGEATWLSLWANDARGSEWVLSRIDGDRLSTVDRVRGSSARPAVVSSDDGAPRLRSAGPGGRR